MQSESLVTYRGYGGSSSYLWNLSREQKELSLATSRDVLDFAAKLQLNNQRLQDLDPMYANPAWALNASFLGGLDESYRHIVDRLELDVPTNKTYSPEQTTPFWSIVAQVVDEEKRLKDEEEQKRSRDREQEDLRVAIARRREQARRCSGCSERGHAYFECITNSINWPLPQWKQERYNCDARGNKLKRDAADQMTR